MNPASEHTGPLTGLLIEPVAPSEARSAAQLQSARHARRLEQLTGDIGTRLRRVCNHLSDAEFSALVLGIAQVTLRYEERESSSPSGPADPSPRGA